MSATLHPPPIPLDVYDLIIARSCLTDSCQSFVDLELISNRLRRKIIITQEKHVPKFRLAPNFFVLLVKAEQETNESGCCLQNKWIFMDKFPINAFKIKGVHMPGRRIFRPWKTHPSSGEPVPNKLLYPLCLQSKPLERISFLSSK